MFRMPLGAFVIAAAVGATSSGSAATLTFGGVPNGEAGCGLGGNPESIVESGFTISNCPGWFVAPGQIHLDDGGSPFQDHVDFSTAGLFEAESVTIIGRGTAFFDVGLNDLVPYDNVLFEGFRDGGLVASQSFSTFGLMGVPATVLFDPEFALLDLLRITQVLPGPDDFARFPNAECVDFPCGHVDLEQIVLNEITPIPLPAPFGPLVIAIVITASIGRRRRQGVAPST